MELVQGLDPPVSLGPRPPAPRPPASRPPDPRPPSGQRRRENNLFCSSLDCWHAAGWSDELKLFLPNCDSTICSLSIKTKLPDLSDSCPLITGRQRWHVAARRRLAQGHVGVASVLAAALTFWFVASLAFGYTLTEEDRDVQPDNQSAAKFSDKVFVYPSWCLIMKMN